MKSSDENTRHAAPAPSLDPAIKAYYDRAPEESRLQLGAFQLEELRTRELSLRHAPGPPAVVLDVGGAAGAYVLVGRTWIRGSAVRCGHAFSRAGA